MQPDTLSCFRVFMAVRTQKVLAVQNPESTEFFRDAEFGVYVLMLLTAMVRSPGGGVKRWLRLGDGFTSYRTSTRLL